MCVCVRLCVSGVRAMWIRFIVSAGENRIAVVYRVEMKRVVRSKCGWWGENVGTVGLV